MFIIINKKCCYLVFKLTNMDSFITQITLEDSNFLKSVTLALFSLETETTYSAEHVHNFCCITSSTSCVMENYIHNTSRYFMCTYILVNYETEEHLLWYAVPLHNKYLKYDRKYIASFLRKAIFICCTIILFKIWYR